MTASSDKVQHYLQQSLEQSLPLVHRGIFSQPQLQAMMLRRQKCQHSMLKTTYQKTDYLSAIEYQYQLQRERRKRMAEMSKLEEGSNPLFRKESGADYAIVKRIIRLWDRTMHKFKFELSLWKQYLSFTIAINSKKHFYKALTQASRFLPYEVDLWKIGAAYQMEKGLNMWKGRRLIFKGLKIVPQGQRNLELSLFMVEYEMLFLRKLVERQNILVKGEAPLKFIGADEQEVQSQQDKAQQQEQEHEPKTINLSSYDEVIWMVIEESFNKNCNAKDRNLTFSSLNDKFREVLIKSKKEEFNVQIKTIIAKVLTKLNDYDGAQLPERARYVKQEQEIKLEGGEQPIRVAMNSKDINDWKQNIFENGIINWSIAEKAFKIFCLKPEVISDLYNFLLAIDPEKTVHFILTKHHSKKIPGHTLSRLIDLHLKEDNSSLTLKVIANQIDRWLTPEDLRKKEDLFSKICAFNQKQNRYESTTRLLRSLSINYRNQPQYLAQCNRIAGAY